MGKFLWGWGGADVHYRVTLYYTHVPSASKVATYSAIEISLI